MQQVYACLVGSCPHEFTKTGLTEVPKTNNLLQNVTNDMFICIYIHIYYIQINMYVYIYNILYIYTLRFFLHKLQLSNCSTQQLLTSSKNRHRTISISRARNNSGCFASSGRPSPGRRKFSWGCHHEKWRFLINKSRQR